MGDAKTECERQSLVCNALCGEVDEINRQIEALIKERTICEEQLAQSQSIEQYKRKKLDEAQERVNILRNTIDNIDRESHMGYLLLRQMVPNLNIMNYA